MSRQIFLDTETTGLLLADGNRILEIGCVEFIDRRPTGRTFHHYINPQRESEEGALRVHGITTEFLADKPLFEAVAQEFVDFVADAELLIHNAPFDVGYLDMELQRLGLGPLAQHTAAITDTLAQAKALYPGQHNSLDALCRRLEVDNSGRQYHGALLDAELLAEVYVRMTRTQSSLLGEVAGDGSDNSAADREDLSAFQSPVLRASQSEEAAHQNMLADIAKKATLVWQNAS